MVMSSRQMAVVIIVGVVPVGVLAGVLRVVVRWVWVFEERSGVFGVVVVLVVMGREWCWCW